MTTRDSSGHYTIMHDGEQLSLPSVTTILNIVAKPALTSWASKMAATFVADNLEVINGLAGDRDALIDLVKGSPWRKRDRAADKGTDAHSLIEQAILDGGYDGDNPYVRAASKFISDYAITFEASEATVYDPWVGYAGTLDGIARFGEVLGVIDWKTRQNKRVAEAYVYETEHLQIAAYAQAPFLVLPNGDTVDKPVLNRGSVIMLCEDGYKIGQVNVEESFLAFESAKRLWDWKKEL